MTDSGFPSFDAQARAFRLAHNVLRARFCEELPHDSLLADLLAGEVLPAVERITTGMSLDARAEHLDLDTTRALLRLRSLPSRPCSAAERQAAREEQLHLAARRRPLDLRAGTFLAAAGHARLVFALIPELPAAEASWPRFPLNHGYTDVARPTGLIELLGRVDELSTVLWRLAIGRLEANEHLRRVYAFCETADWLERSGWQAGSEPG